MKFRLASSQSKRLVNLLLVFVAVAALAIFWFTQRSAPLLVPDAPVVRSQPRSGVVTNAAADHLTIQAPGSQRTDLVRLSPRTTVRMLKQDGTFVAADRAALANGAYVIVTVDSAGAFPVWSIDVMPRFAKASS